MRLRLSVALSAALARAIAAPASSAMTQAARGRPDARADTDRGSGKRGRAESGWGTASERRHPHENAIATDAARAVADDDEHARKPDRELPIRSPPPPRFRPLRLA